MTAHPVIAPEQLRGQQIDRVIVMNPIYCDEIAARLRDLGVAADRAQIDLYKVHDAEDPRRRAFFCLLPDGRPALGATTYVTPSANLALALQFIGVHEAVLLDSGFSTSLVYGKQILVTGHTSPGIPSRPVPHALVLFGRPAPNAPALPRSALMASW